MVAIIEQRTSDIDEMRNVMNGLSALEYNTVEWVLCRASKVGNEFRVLKVKAKEWQRQRSKRDRIHDNSSRWVRTRPLYFRVFLIFGSFHEIKIWETPEFKGDVALFCRTTPC
jgi:hypothetical protein